MPDYSEFNHFAASVAKIMSHQHPDGSIHVEIDCMFPPGTEEVVEVLREGFDKLMKSLPGAMMVSTENYFGIEAELNDKPITQVYEELRNKPRDHSHEN